VLLAVWDFADADFLELRYDIYDLTAKTNPPSNISLKYSLATLWPDEQALSTVQH